MSNLNRPFRTPIFHIFTDAAAKKSSNESSIGIYSPSNKSLNFSAKIENPDKSAQFGEILAAIVCLMRIQKRDDLHILLLTDSNFIIKGLHYLKSIENRGNPGWSTEILEFVEKYEIYLEKLRTLGQTFPGNVTILYVPAHRGIFGNEMADYFAKFPIYTTEEIRDMSHKQEKSEPMTWWTQEYYTIYYDPKAVKPKFPKWESVLSQVELPDVDNNELLKKLVPPSHTRDNVERLMYCLRLPKANRSECPNVFYYFKHKCTPYCNHSSESIDEKSRRVPIKSPRGIG